MKNREVHYNDMIPIRSPEGQSIISKAFSNLIDVFDGAQKAGNIPDLGEYNYPSMKVKIKVSESSTTTICLKEGNYYGKLSIS